MDLLLNELGRFLGGACGLPRHALFLREPGKGYQWVWADRGQSWRELGSIQEEAPAARFFRRWPGHLLRAGDADRTESPAAQHLRALGADFCIPAQWQQALHGFILATRDPSAPPAPEELLNTALLLGKFLGFELQQSFLRDELDMIGFISNGLAHDLQIFLTPVQTCLQLLQEAGPAGGAAELAPVALKNLRLARDSVREALAFSKTPAVESGPVRLSSLLDQAESLLAEPLQEKGLRVERRMEADLTTGLNEPLMRRVMLNLLANAIQAAPPNSAIAVEASAGRNESANSLRLRILNASGAGATPAPDAAASGGPRERHGLGLAICQNIVALHGGRLRVRFDESGAATVEIELPAG